MAVPSDAQAVLVDAGTNLRLTGTRVLTAILITLAISISGCGVSSTQSPPTSTPGATPIPPTTIPTTTPVPIALSIVSLVANGTELSAVENVYSVPDELNPGDSVKLIIDVRDDSDGSFELLGVKRAYSPSEEKEAQLVRDLILPANLTSNELRGILSSNSESVEFVLRFEPGDGWAPYVTLESPYGLTDDVELEVVVRDLNGPYGVDLVNVTQEFNYQDTGNKSVQEYVSNNSLSPIVIEELEPARYEVRFSTEWPGRFPLLFTAVDPEGNESTTRVPVEVFWSENPFANRGVSIEIWGDPRESKDVTNWERSPKALEEIESLNANMTMLLVIGAMDTRESTEIYHCYERQVGQQWCITPTEQQITEVVELAHEKGIQVVISPVLLADQERKLEFFQLAPSDWDDFFESYVSWILEWARIAERTSVDLFSISFAAGDLLTPHNSDFQALLTRVREVYSGAVMAQNFWSSGGYPSFFGDVDVIGHPVFYSATESFGEVYDPTPQQMYQELGFTFEGVIKPLWPRFGNPILFTELGSYNIDGSAINPTTTWMRVSDPVIDNQEQVDYFEAGLRNIAETKGQIGVIIWSHTIFDNVPRFDYFPHNAPVRDLVRIWFADPSSQGGVSSQQ